MPNKNKKSLRVINIFVIFYFIVAPLLGAIIFSLNGISGMGIVLAIIFILSCLLYWFYGIDYFEVDWFKKKERIQ
ncbi:MAG TPA: hypothetical protein VK106_04500 [Balneolaceae bacterium]|nr:hypothetical protein [Balneolaceae bacterium]